MEHFDLHSIVAEWLSATPDRHTLIAASLDGTVWRLDGTARALYSHRERPAQTAISENGRLLASCARNGSIAVFDLVSSRLVSTRFAHSAGDCGIGWDADELWSSGADGAFRTWQVRGDRLVPNHLMQAPASLHMTKVIQHTWAAAEGTNAFAIGTVDGSTLGRLDLGGVITALEISADRRYIAASVKDEIVVVDLERHAIATALFGAPVRQLAFFDRDELAFAQPDALRTLRLTQLNYVPFEWSPEPPNRASF